MKLIDRLMHSHAPRATVLIRLMTGCVFLSEGVQKFLQPASRGAGRFANIGIPWPDLTGPFIGVIEIACGILLLLGLATRPAAALLVINMAVAILTTKVPILLGHGFWGFGLSKLPSYGFWSMAHEARTDFAMLLGLLFLVIVGAGSCSLDDAIARRKRV